MTFSEFVKSETGYHWDDYSEILDQKGYSDIKINDIQNYYLNKYFNYCEKINIKPELFYRI